MDHSSSDFYFWLNQLLDKEQNAKEKTKLKNFPFSV